MALARDTYMNFSMDASELLQCPEGGSHLHLPDPPAILILEHEFMIHSVYATNIRFRERTLGVSVTTGVKWGGWWVRFVRMVMVTQQVALTRRCAPLPTFNQAHGAPNFCNVRRSAKWSNWRAVSRSRHGPWPRTSSQRLPCRSRKRLWSSTSSLQPSSIFTQHLPSVLYAQPVIRTLIRVASALHRNAIAGLD